MSHFIVRTVLFLALFAVGLSRLTIPAHAADFVVTHTGDSGEGSLRQAILNANAAVGADTITFQSGLTGTITLTDHLPQITDGLTVTGPGISALTIDGGGIYNAFATPASISFTLDFNNLTIANALTAVDTKTAMVYLTDLVITGSTSRAVWVTNGQLFIERVTFADNTGLATLDVVSNYTNFLIRDSTFSGNVSTDANSATLKMSFSDGYATIVNTTFADNAGAAAGAISMSVSNARVIMDASTFSGNSGARAGAIAFSGPNVDLIIDNSTFSGNSATTITGADAIYAIVSSVSVYINFSTFSGHDSTMGSDTVGILYVDGSSPYIELTNSIIANNPASAPGALLECSFNPDKVDARGSNNLTGDANCPGHVGVPTNVDPVLADNGGPTRTHALLPGSNAIDKVGCTNIDQRYVDRPQGTSCDLGAFEYVPPVVSISPASQAIAEGTNANVTLTRTGDVSAALTVSLNVTAGTGTTPSDYTLSGGGVSDQSGTVAVTFPAGSDAVALNVAALVDAAGAEPANTLAFALVDGADYDLGTATSAGVTIPANDLMVTHTGDSGEGSLRQAITNANADGVDSTISFAPSANGTITLLSELPYLINNGTLTIEGNGQTNTIISGNDTVGVLLIEASADVTINRLTITRGNGLDAGGGIANYMGTLSLNEVLVSDNAAHQGGGIINVGGTLTITGSTVTGNSAGSHGGGISNFGYEMEATLKVIDSTVAGNDSGVSGGGIFNSGTATIVRSTIADNTAIDYHGGGIVSEGELTVMDSTISGNSAGQIGGGIDSIFAALTISGSTFTGNSAKYVGGGFSNVGGVVMLSSSEIYDNSILDNDGIGGGIFTQGYDGYGELTVNNTTITGNTGGWGGGGISNIDSTVSLNNVTVSGNVARRGGGIINNNNQGRGTMTLNNSTVSWNTATGNDPDGIEGGGGIWNAGTFTLNGSTVSGNTAARGGGIYNSIRTAIPPGGTLTVTNSTIAANTASISADGLLVHGSAAVLNNTVLSNGDEDCIAQNDATVAANYSLFSNTAACGALEANGNLIGRDPLLGALVTPSDGSPAYYPLLAGSPAIDAGNDALVPDGLTTDQAGNPRVFGATVDMGSVEFTASNLLVNGSFETAGAVASKARKWQAVGLTTADKRKCDTPTKVFAYAGSCAFKFKSAAPAGVARVIRQKVDVAGVETDSRVLTLSAWVQAKKLTAGAKLKLKIRYADGTTAKAVVKMPLGTYLYTRLTGTQTLTKAVAWIETSIVAGPSRGTIFVDDLWLTIAPASARMATTRSLDGLLPPPAAPDGFRGSN